MTAAADTVCTIIPCLRYADAPAAIAWLARAFGFEPALVVPGEDGSIVHAELRYGRGMVMLCTAYADGWGARMVRPAEIGGRSTQTCCVIVADPDAHHARAVAAGAEVVEPLRDNPYGGRSYSVRDCEGLLWTFGSYDPWQGAA